MPKLRVASIRKLLLSRDFKICWLRTTKREPVKDTSRLAGPSGASHKRCRNLFSPGGLFLVCCLTLATRQRHPSLEGGKAKPEDCPLLPVCPAGSYRSSKHHPQRKKITLALYTGGGRLGRMVGSAILRRLRAHCDRTVSDLTQQHSLVFQPDRVSHVSN